MNNKNLGLVRQQQTLFYGSRINATQNQRHIDFAAIANAMGAFGIDLSHHEQPELVLADTLLRPGPCVINIDVNEEEMVFPMVPPGAANSKMIVEATQ